MIERDAPERRPPPRRLPVWFGLDLGQAADYTALCALAPVLPGRPTEKFRYHVPLLHRWPLGTPYLEIAEDLAALVKAQAAPAILALDQTGCGRPVVEMVAQTLTDAQVPGFLCAVTITGGHETTAVGGGQWHVPKKVLASVLQVLLQSRRLHVAAELPEAETLVRELSNFKVKITTAANETYEAWREKDHDDMVLAVALAAWAAEHGIGLAEVLAPPLDARPLRAG
jgi:hypothetical protein